MNPMTWSTRRMIAVRAVLTFWLAATMPPAFAGTNAIVTADDWDLYRGARIVTRKLETEAACVAGAKVAGPGVYTCRTQTGVAVTVTADPPPTCTSSQPGADVRAGTCPAGTTGVWAQTRTYAAATYPQCWLVGDWLPASAPDGACTTPPPPPPPLTDADAQWKADSAAPGVSAAYGFDSADEVKRGYQPGANGARGFWDAQVKRSGAGSLRLEVHAGDSGANISGQWGLASNTLGKGYGSNSEMWLGFDYRADAAFVADRSGWDSNPKIISIYAGSTPCQSLELTLVWPRVGETLYTQCGNLNLSTSTTSAKGQTNAPPYLYQQSWDLTAGGSARVADGVQAAYPSAPAFQFVADKWHRVQIHAKLARLGSPGSIVEMWVQPEGGKWIKVIAWTGTITMDQVPALDNLVLMPYMTGLKARTKANGNIWYDGLVIGSTRPPSLPPTLH